MNSIFNTEKTDIGEDLKYNKFSRFTIASFSVENTNRSSQSGIDLKSIRCLAKRKIKLLRVLGYYWEFWDVGKVPKKHMKRLCTYNSKGEFLCDHNARWIFKAIWLVVLINDIILKQSDWLKVHHPLYLEKNSPLVCLIGWLLIHSKD